jgi:hypothetical protein
MITDITKNKTLDIKINKSTRAIRSGHIRRLEAGDSCQILQHHIRVSF